MGYLLCSSWVRTTRWCRCLSCYSCVSLTRKSCQCTYGFQTKQTSNPWQDLMNDATKLLFTLWGGTPPTDPDTKYPHSTRLNKPSIILIQVITFLIDIQWSKPALTTLGFWKAFRCNYQLHTPALYKGSTKRHGYYCVNWAGRIYWVFACHTVLQECHHGSADLAGLVFLYWTFYSCTVVNTGCCQPQERSG